MKRATTTAIAAIFLIGGGAIAANAEDATPPTLTPFTTCMNCK